VHLSIPYFEVLISLCQVFICKTISTALPFCNPFLLSIKTAASQGRGLSLFYIFVYYLVQWSLWMLSQDILTGYYQGGLLDNAMKISIIHHKPDSITN